MRGWGVGMKRIVFTSGLLFLFVGAAANCALAADQAWMTNTLKISASKNFSLQFCHESRYAEGMSFGDPFLDGIQGGLTSKLPAKFYVGVLYRRENLQTQTLEESENRVAVQGGWTPGIFGGITLISRFRVESRYFEQNLIEDHIRFRAKVGFSYKAQFGRFSVAPFVATEVFGDDREHWGDYPNRNRFLLGTQIFLIDHMGVTVNYVRQDTKGRPIVHAFNTGINLSL